MLEMNMIVFEYTKGAVRKLFWSTSIDRGIDIDRIDVEKSTFETKAEKLLARKRKIVRSPKTTMRRFY